MHNFVSQLNGQLEYQLQSMGKTITTYLLEGTPKGIQSIQISNRTIMAYIIPRSEIKKCHELEELHTPCLYILFGEDNEGKSKAYIGQAENFLERIIDHNRKKDFWDRAMVFVSQAGTINKGEVLYLEYLAIEQAKKADQYLLDENKQNPKAPTLQRHLKDSMEEFFEDVKFLAEFLGYFLFKVVDVEAEVKELFFLRNRGANLKGFYDENGFTVLKGSLLPKDSVPSLGNLIVKRKQFIQNN